MQRMALLFCLACFFTACFADLAYSLSPAYQAAIQRSARKNYDMHYRYKLGGNPSDGEIDCSELIRKIAKDARIPGISDKRLQAWMIARGYGGFTNRPVEDWQNGNTEIGDLLCMHLANGLDRPDGINHIGMTVLWSGVHQVMHASGGMKRVVVIPFQDWIEKAIQNKGYRRMIAGDKKEKEDGG